MKITFYEKFVGELSVEIKGTEKAVNTFVDKTFEFSSVTGKPYIWKKGVNTTI